MRTVGNLTDHYATGPQATGKVYERRRCSNMTTGGLLEMNFPAGASFRDDHHRQTDSEIIQKPTVLLASSESTRAHNCAGRHGLCRPVSATQPPTVSVSASAQRACCTRKFSGDSKKFGGCCAEPEEIGQFAATVSCAESGSPTKVLLPAQGTSTN